MSEIVYVNGKYVAKEDAVISVFDRGFLMSDAVYEVASVINGKLLDNGAVDGSSRNAPSGSCSIRDVKSQTWFPAAEPKSKLAPFKVSSDINTVSPKVAM